VTTRAGRPLVRPLDIASPGLPNLAHAVVVGLVCIFLDFAVSQAAVGRAAAEAVHGDGGEQ
jgi:hypothetical protein